LSFVLIFTLVACTGGNTEAPKTDAPAAEAPATETPAADEPTQTFKVGFANASSGNPWRASMMDSVNGAWKKYGDMLNLIITDANDDVQKQMADCEDLLEQWIDALILSPCVSDALAPVVDWCNDKGVPIIVFDRIISNPNYTAYVATDNHELAIPVAEYIVENYPDGANIVYLSGIAGAGPDIERTAGLESVIGDKPEYKILTQIDAYWNEADGMVACEDALQAYPNIDIVLCSDGNTGVGALRAINAANRGDQIDVICFDAWRNDSLRNIEEENIVPYTTMLNTAVGAVTVDTTMQLLLGATPKAADRYIRIPCPIITKDNYDSFWDRSLPDTEYSWRPAYEQYMATQFLDQFNNPVIF
jgi:ABC-type sugar transport system substrate-binding protein